LAGQRGYTSKGREKAKDARVPDLKEFWQRGQDNNPLVDELPRFDEVTSEVFHRLETAGRELLKAIAIYLGLAEDYFEPKVIQGNSILRAIHYFPIEDPDSLPDDAVRAGAHEDINLITSFIAAAADGLKDFTRTAHGIHV